MDRPIRLMTANLLSGRADVVHLDSILRQFDPDLLLIQELGENAADLIADRFEHHDLHPDLEAKGRGIASKLPGTFLELPLPWRPGLWARLDLGLQVANIHVRNAVAFPWWTSVKYRGTQLDSLFEWAEVNLDPSVPFVLAGDMNASPAWPVYRSLAERWDDLVARWAEQSGNRLMPTWGWRPGWPRMLRIDHVFGRGLSVNSTSVAPIRGSDHAAVVVDLVSD